MTTALPIVSSPAGLTPCFENSAFYQVRTTAQGELLARHYCGQCPAVAACESLAVATKAQFGTLYGVWAGRVYTLDGSNRT